MEIGSEFWDVPSRAEQNKLFPSDAQWYLSGRVALQAIIKDISWARTVAMPSWCCDSMVKPFVEAGIQVDFYPVYYKDGLIQEIEMERDVLFLIDYFGYTESALDLGNYKGIVIRDVTHSLFSRSYTDTDYYFGSLRKWCGVWTGGYVWTRDGHQLVMEQNDDYGYALIRQRAMEQKNRYIHGWPDKQGLMADKSYLDVFNKAEDILEKCNIAPADDRDVWIAHRIDVKFVRDRRRANAKVLMDELADYLIFPEIKDECPMFVPILVPDGKRDALRKYLINNQVYCPVHWPVSEYHDLEDSTKYLYQNSLSLVCDQRYTEEDMKYEADLVKLFLGE